MDTLAQYRQIIQAVLLIYTNIPYAHGRIQCKPVFDVERDSYVLLTEGWAGPKRIHGCLVHIEIIHDKVWVQRDEIDSGITYDLVHAGIPKSAIVLGFQEASVRPFTEYATA
ncbi:MAG: XisI protein [Chloroflexia bacterium]|nr:XisI protein [Chloroflexia bacterium]